MRVRTLHEVRDLQAAFRAGVQEGRRHRDDWSRYGAIHQGNGNGGTECGLPKDESRAPGSPYVTCPDCLFGSYLYREGKKT